MGDSGGAAEFFKEKISAVASPVAATKPLPRTGPAVAVLLFSPRPRQFPTMEPHLYPALFASFRETTVSPGAGGICVMQRMRKLLRSAPSRIGRRLAQIVAIAAASLPEAGA
jgi:hypothetical protein